MNPLEKAARISKPFGLQGELIVNLYDCFPADFDTEEPLFAQIDSLTVPLFLEKFEPRGRSGALVKFADFDTDTRTAEFIGKELYITTGQAEEGNNDDGLIYFEELVGFVVKFDDSPLKGEVSSFIDSENNPLFEIIAEGKQIYVPANEEMIAALDIEKKEIEFTLPEGLLELYL